MKNFTGKALVIAASLLAVVLVLTTPVHATLQVSVTVYDIVNPITGYSNVIVDNGAGDFDPAVGAIALGNNFQPIPNFIVQGSYHTSKMGGQNLITSGSSSVNNNRGTTTRAYVAISDTDFRPPASMFQVTGSGTFTQAIGSTIHLGYYDDPANGQGANFAFADLADFLANNWKLTPGNLVDAFNYAAAIPLDSYSYNSGLKPLAVPDLDPFSMTLLFDFNLTPQGQLTSRGQSMLKAVPEPTTIFLLGAGLIGIAALRRKVK